MLHEKLARMVFCNATHENTAQYGLKSVRYFGAKFCNDIQLIRHSIPIDIKRPPSACSFRRKLKAFFFEKNYDLC